MIKCYSISSKKLKKSIKLQKLIKAGNTSYNATKKQLIKLTTSLINLKLKSKLLNYNYLKYYNTKYSNLNVLILSTLLKNPNFCLLMQKNN